jgi:hypothetical protein
MGVTLADQYPHLVPRSWICRSYTCSSPLRLHSCVVGVLFYLLLCMWNIYNTSVFSVVSVHHIHNWLDSPTWALAFIRSFCQLKYPVFFRFRDKCFCLYVLYFIAYSASCVILSNLQINVMFICMHVCMHLFNLQKCCTGVDDSGVGPV